MPKNPTPKTAVQLSDDLFEANFPHFRAFREARVSLLDWLAGARYEGDTGEFNKDRRGIQIRGQETTDTNAHVVAKVTEKPRSIEGRPQNHEGDAELSEMAVALVTQELAVPEKGFDRENYACLTSAVESRAGCVWMDWDPDCGMWGELIYSWQDMNRIMWDLPWHPHHPLCGWLMRDKRIDVEVARKRYKAPWLEPDKVSMGAGRTNASGPIIDGYTDRLALVCAKDNKVTIRELWIKNDPTEADKPITQTTEPVPVGQRYMSCSAGCGWKSPTENILRKTGAIGPKAQLPDDLPQGCATCGGDTVKIVAKDIDATVLAYSRGRRLIITAPHCADPKGAPLYDGNWPITKLRSFPARFSFYSVKPGAIAGPCITDKMWDQQAASDQLKTLAITRIFEHRNYWIMPAAGIIDRRGKRFEFRNDQENVMFRDARFSKHGPLDVESKNATGLDVNWGLVNSVIDNSLTRYRPSGDLGLEADQSKDIAVGTAEIIQQQGEVQTNDFIRRDNHELGMWYGIVSDGIAGTYPPERVAALNIEGGEVLLKVWGESMPGYNFTVSETPAYSGLDKDRAAAWPALMQAYQEAVTLGFDPLAAIEIYATLNNLPKSVVRQFTKMIQEKQEAEAKAAAMGVAAPGTQGMGDPAQDGTGADAMSMADTGATDASTPLANAA